MRRKHTHLWGFDVQVARPRLKRKRERACARETWVRSARHVHQQDNPCRHRINERTSHSQGRSLMSLWESSYHLLPHSDHEDNGVAQLTY